MKINFVNELPKNSGGIYAVCNTMMKNLKNHKVQVTANKLNNYDILHVNTVGPFSMYQIKLARKMGKRVVIHAHSIDKDFENSFTFSNELSSYLGKYLKYFYNKADVVISPTKYSKNELIRMGVKKPIEIISGGVDINKFKPLKKPCKEYIFSVGQVFLRKGIDTFISLAKEFQNTKFKWFGPSYNYLFTNPIKMNRILNDASPNFELEGFAKNIIKVYQNGKIFVFPSYEETQGIPVIEAAACEKPIIIRDIPVYDGIMKNYKNCIMCKSDKDFKDAVDLLLKNDKLQKRLGKEAMKVAEKNSTEITTKKLIKLYKNLLN
jgi:1,2-diacylglycerol-3-alpha-glucose alpha-1,2-glucosyltransferase